MKVLCFSIYLATNRIHARSKIKKKDYIKGLFNNLELAKVIYPDWEVWVYVGKNTIDQETKDKIKKEVDKVIEFDDTNSFVGMRVRFIPAGNKDIEYFCSKDVDSSLNWKEKAAVDAWIESGKDWLTMRDAPIHCNWPMIAQMWGCKGGLINFEEELNNYFNERNINSWHGDQEFLRDVIWPVAKENCLDFDSHKLKDWGTKMIDYPKHKDDKDYPHIGSSIIRNAHIK